MPSLGSRLARGEESAFAELYDTAADRLYRFLSARLRSTDAAADVLQTTFLRAVEKRRNFARVENPLGYLYRIAVNEAARVLARDRSGTSRQSSVEELATEDNHTRDDAEVVAMAMTRLNSDDRELVALKIFGGLTFREISEALNIPLGTVTTRYRRALESLRPWLTRQLL